MRDYAIYIFQSDDGKGYVADIPDLESCSAFGATPEEAFDKLVTLKGEWIETAKAEGKPIPEPRHRPIVYK